MNVTKNELIEALNYLGEFPKTSQKKNELMMKLNNIYDGEIEKLVIVINTKIYDLIKRLVQSDVNGIDVEEKYEPEVNFLESTLIIDEPTMYNKKIHIKFNENMKEKFSKFINNKNENSVKKNQKIVDLMINIVDVYGIIKDYEMLDMLNKLLNTEMRIESIYALIYSQIDLRTEIVISENEYEVYLMNCLVQHPEDIIEERERRNLYYKEHTIQELEKYKFENLINCNEAKEIIKFLEKRKIEFAEEIVFSMILYIMNIPQININDFMNIIKIDFENLDEANEYLQLIMSLHNNIPHYSLYGYSPMDLIKMQIEEGKKEEIDRARKIGRNEPCPCASGKKYKNCCLNKVIKVDFRNEKYNDCVAEEDAKMFFALKNLVFNYTNEKYHINDELEDFEDICEAKPEDVREIREKVWNDENVIKEYIERNPNELNSEFIHVLEQWNEKKINKEFILYKYEDEHAIFIDDENIYYVKGLKERIREMIPQSKLPIFVKTVLLPLNNQIIYDSYIEQYNVSFGKGMKDIWDKNYKEMLKQNKTKYEL